MANDEKSIWTKFGFNQPIKSLIEHGPAAPVGIGPAGSQTSISALAQIDTGAAGCGISPRLVKRLNLQPVGSGTIHEAGREPVTADFFFVRLTLPAMNIELNVAGLPSLALPHDVLIGRDVLARFRLLVDFTSGVTQLHFKNGP